MTRLFLITPVRDEIDNLPRLEAAVKAQAVAVDDWILLENGSTDGSRDYLAALQPGGSVRALSVMEEDTGTPEYALGFKYARLIAHGISHMRTRHNLHDDDVIGILDADTFPAPDYYQKLIAALDASPNLGIISGITTDAHGRPSIHRRNWVRGSCRVWRAACLNSIGYPIGPSADTLSVIKAEIRGWDVAVIEDARAEAREVGARVKFGYYGESAYFRGETLLHCLLRAGKYARAGRLQAALQFSRGYLENWWSNAPRTEDKEILDWCRGSVLRRLRERWRRI